MLPPLAVPRRRGLRHLYLPLAGMGDALANHSLTFDRPLAKCYKSNDFERPCVEPSRSLPGYSISRAIKRRSTHWFKFVPSTKWGFLVVWPSSSRRGQKVTRHTGVREKEPRKFTRLIRIFFLFTEEC